MTVAAPPAPEAGVRPPQSDRARRWWAATRRSAWGRGGLFAALAGLLSAVMFMAIGALGWAAPGTPDALRLPALLARQLVPTLGAFWLLAVWIERRRVPELSLRRMVPGVASGLAGGLLLIGGVFGVLWALGAYRVEGLGTGDGWARSLIVVGLGAAIAEEVIFRGVLYRLVAEARGDGWALAVSALFFGGVHLGNPNATLWTSIAIGIEAGLLLGAVYAVTRSLWPCIGVHMAWNVLEGQVFGSPVSGTTVSDPWLRPVWSGPEWLTGGAFGIEASAVTVVVCLAATIALLAARRRAPSPTPAPEGATPC